MLNFNFRKRLSMGIGDWGLGPIPNPQSPIPNPHKRLTNFNLIIYKLNISLKKYF